ncbi:MAG: leucine-rich repeat domain-containing protein [Spirochaetaceae bacterium]|nr:leucine-rich repeat domain-containing protein [Spirochaetaceae bacterium]
MPVVSLYGGEDSSAFRDCTRLTSVTIPNSATYIESNAFSGCTRLTDVTLSHKIDASNTGFPSSAQLWYIE